MEIVGRKKEISELKRLLNSGRPEFIAVTGRRRVGKTFLIRELFAEETVFYFSGSLGKGVNNKYQLMKFDEALSKTFIAKKGISKNWSDAFSSLEKQISRMEPERKVIFIDELPWLDNPKSDFLPALDYFWNTFVSSRTDIMLIICGSATSWIVKNIFHNKGGLHNRITARVHLAPFTLGETEELFKHLGVVMSRYQIAESYMIFGGIPYYLCMFSKELSLTQNVDKLVFAELAPLRSEYHEVFASLYRSPERHMTIIKALSQKAAGLTRKEIIERTKIPSSGNLTQTLNELHQCGFIEMYSDFTKTKKESYFRLIDPFTLFCIKYVNDYNGKDDYYWTNLLDDSGRRAWSGFTFEMICLKHLFQIKKALGISGISTEVSSWRSRESKPGAQIDLLISRRDGIVNLCEIKFSLHPITLSAKDADVINNKKVAFIEETKIKSAVHVTLISTYGMEKKGYFSGIQSEVVLDDLFEM